MLKFETRTVVFVALVCFLGLALTLPNFLPGKTAESLPGWLPHKQISLGLDLQGGSHLLMEVDVAVVIEERLDNLVSEIRRSLRDAGIGYTGLGSDSRRATVTIRDLDRLDEALDLLRGLMPNADVAGDDTGAVQITFSEAAAAEIRTDAVTRSIEIVRNRIDEMGTREPTVQRQGDDRVLVQVPGFDDPERLIDIIGKTAKMNFRLVNETASIQAALQGQVPSDSELLYNTGRTTEAGQPVPIVVYKRIGVSGENLTDAQATFYENQPVVSLRFDSVGARRFSDLTREHVEERFAIVLDGEVISAPVINEPITGGSGIISGRFTAETAGDLALLLRSGALPAPLQILEERSVGPSLGADSVAAGKIAVVVGLVLVVGYMILSYGLFGVASTVALTANMFLILGLLSLLQATLTLPGIAGIVLTIGMAVDANVLIFERIREEVRNGRPPFSAVDIGFRQAFRTIVDANVTTFIAGALLFIFGAGPVKGFAVTLMIGIATSMFTAIMVTRILIVLWLRRTRSQTLPV